MAVFKYYLGLDMGTNSVGWAVTDIQYNILKVKGKDLWGIREFNEASTAAERRTHRVSRRARQRKTVLIGLLKYYFHDEICKKDPYFFQRVDNSKYHLEDKDDEVKYTYNIFNDINYTDADYFKQYPTIFHLRNELIFNPNEHDIRLVYLALLNMFKHRGHFLNDSLIDDDSEMKIDEAYLELANLLSEYTEYYLKTDVNITELENILSDRDESRTKKFEKIVELLEIDSKNKPYKEMIRGLCGLKFNAITIFSDVQLEDGQKLDICLSDASFEEKADDIASILGEDYFQIILSMKRLYDIGSLSEIMKGYSYLSEARVASYKKHKEDLCCLKRVIKKYCNKECYEKIFNSDEDGSYASYVGSFNSNSKQRRVGNKRSIEDLYKEIKKILKAVPQEDADVQRILTSIDNETFLPKQLTASNGIIPNQIHEKEMKKILSNAENYLPFLKEKDEKNQTVSERILKLFTFQIPYYVGPTTENSQKNGGNGWVIRKEAGQVLPWNIEEKIDMKATSEAFISRMIRRCTYISGKPVLPRASLEYQSFCVLNDINNIKIDGYRISVELKQDIYNDLFLKGKKVTKKQLCKYLYSRGLITSENQVSGIDIEINNTLSTYKIFKNIFGDDIIYDSTKIMIEDIVFWCTVYGESKKFLRERLCEKYGDKLSQDQIKKILGLKFKDWGNLSKDFLELSGVNKETNESMSIIKALWENNLNMMELINSDLFDFKEKIVEYQTDLMKTIYNIEVDDLENYYFSAPVKRMVWQTILVVKELVGVLGCEPTRIFIEMTRKHDEIAKRTINRKKKFEALYKSVKDEDTDWMNVIADADDTGRIRSKKMYLYLTQKGKCMYTGKHIELSDLFNSNLYDIDHIYPRHFVKDDNIDNNLVLVCKDKNAHKSDIYPLEEQIYSSQKEMWSELKKLGFINEEKYNRLTGRNSFTDEQKAGFIARQLVETSQGTKGIANILQQLLPESKIVYAKASNVSEFRQSRDIPKSRLVNEFHHAHDAYLNIVVGNVYYVKFTQDPLNFIKNDYDKDKINNNYNLSKMFDWDVKRKGEVAWIAQKKNGDVGTIATVKKVMSKNTPLMTRYCFEGRGKISKEERHSAKEAKQIGYLPYKTSDLKIKDVTKYGGFTSITVAYYFVVEHDEKKKRIRTIESVPLYLADKINSNHEELDKYCKNELGLVNFNIRVRKIRIGSLLKQNGYFFYITGKTGNRLIVRNAVNICFRKEWIKYSSKIEKYQEKKIIDDIITKDKNELFYDEFIKKYENSIFANRPNSILEKLKKAFPVFKESNIEQQCSILYQLLNLSKILGSECDLRLIGESPNCGKMLINKKIGDDDIYLINQSVTGLYENKINLRTV